MIQFTLNLYNKSYRPMFSLDNSLVALLDTGAIIPVWFGSEDTLIDIYNAKFIKDDIIVEGLGGETKGKLYEIPILEIGKFIYPYLPIVVCKTNIDNKEPYSLLLSATMFGECVYEIDTVNHKLNIDAHDDNIIRNIKVTDSDGKIHVLCTYGKEA